MRLSFFSNVFMAGIAVLLASNSCFALIDIVATSFPDPKFRTGLNLHLFDHDGRLQGNAYSLEEQDEEACLTLLGHLQAMPLNTMLARKVITREQMEGLLKLEDFLKNDQVVFLSATSTAKGKDILGVDRQTKAKLKEMGIQLNLEAFVGPTEYTTGETEDAIAFRAMSTVRRGTIWVVRGQSIQSTKKYILPWHLDENFQSFASLPHDDLLSFEFGRGSATEESVFDTLFDEAVLTAVGEAYYKKIPLNRAKVYAHAISEAHAKHYLELWPFHRLYKNPNGKDWILAASLAELYSDEMILRRSRVAHYTSELIGAKISAHEIKEAIEIKKQNLSEILTFKFNQTETHLMVKNSIPISFAETLGALQKKYPQWSEQEIVRLGAGIFHEATTTRVPVTAEFLRDPIHSSVANDKLVRGWQIQNLDEELAKKNSNYAITAVRSVYIRALNLLSERSPLYYRSHLSADDGIMVLTSSAVIANQLALAGARVTKKTTQPSFVYSMLTAIKNQRRNLIHDYYEVFFDAPTLSRHQPANPLEAMALLHTTDPAPETLQNLIQEFLID